MTASWARKTSAPWPRRLSWQRRLRFRFGSWRLGGDYFGRRGVSTKERDYAIGSLEPQLVDERETLASGAEDELGLFDSVDVLLRGEV